jgi:hypothetical protein
MKKEKFTLKVYPTTKKRLRAVANVLGYKSVSQFLDHFADYLYSMMLLDLKDKGFLTESFLTDEDRKLMSTYLKDYAAYRIKKNGAGQTPYLPFKKRREE